MLHVTHIINLVFFPFFEIYMMNHKALARAKKSQGLGLAMGDLVVGSIGEGGESEWP